jgi:NADH-quinone oxidoreductase subunit B
VLVDLPLACCGLESSRAFVAARAESDPIAVVLCISGTVTTRSAPTVAARIAQAESEYPRLPLYRVAVGACACSGGPYWDSPAVLPASGPIDLMVPGCPPSPQAIADAVCAWVEAR